MRGRKFFYQLLGVGANEQLARLTRASDRKLRAVTVYVFLNAPIGDGEDLLQSRIAAQAAHRFCKEKGSR